MAYPHKRSVLNCDMKNKFIGSFLLGMLIYGVILAKKMKFLITSFEYF